jgi:hypothetical protein
MEPSAPSGLPVPVPPRFPDHFLHPARVLPNLTYEAFEMGRHFSQGSGSVLVVVSAQIAQ